MKCNDLFRQEIYSVHFASFYGAGSRLQALVLMRFENSLFASWPAGLVGTLGRAAFPFLAPLRNALRHRKTSRPSLPRLLSLLLDTAYLTC
jgi:hypothetical protein